MHVRPVYDDLGAVATILEGVSTTDLAQSNSLGEHRILLLVEPNKLQHVPESVELLSRYIHDLTIWIFDPTRSNSLRAVLAKDMQATMPSTQTIQATPTPAAKAPTKPGMKVDIHPSPQRTLRLRTDNAEGETTTLTSATGQTNWVGPWIEGPPATAPTPISAAPAPLRDTNERTSARSTPEKPRTEKVSPENLAPEPLLSDEELAMLLGDDPPAPPSRKG